MMEVVWTGSRSWGVEHFRDFVEGKLFRRATKRETPDIVVPTKYGMVELKRMTRREINEIDPNKGMA